MKIILGSLNIFVRRYFSWFFLSEGKFLLQDIASIWCSEGKWSWNWWFSPSWGRNLFKARFYKKGGISITWVVPFIFAQMSVCGNLQTKAKAFSTAFSQKHYHIQTSFPFSRTYHSSHLLLPSQPPTDWMNLEAKILILPNSSHYPMSYLKCSALCKWQWACSYTQPSNKGCSLMTSTCLWCSYGVTVWLHPLHSINRLSADR